MPIIRPINRNNSATIEKSIKQITIIWLQIDWRAEFSGLNAINVEAKFAPKIIISYKIISYIDHLLRNGFIKIS